VGSEYVRKRGAQLKKWLTDEINSKRGCNKTEDIITEYRPTQRSISGCETNEAI
jgi:hypothetical protein